MSEPQEWNLKYRPKTLDKVEGNLAAVGILNAWFTDKEIPHFVLLTGAPGSGKTTIARIIKNQLGCHELDYKEMNSAMFRGIDTIRDIQSGIRVSPAAGPCRVLLFDEVHQLSKDAMEAANKITEDTPSHVYFIFCTTDPQKLLPALRQRAREIKTEALTETQAHALLFRVLKKEGLELTDRVKHLLVEGAEGCARALLINAQKVAAVPEDQREAVAASSREMAAEGIDLCRALLAGKGWPEVARILAAIKGEPESVRRGVLGYCRTVLLKEGVGRKGMRAYLIMDCFSKNLYDTGAAGLVYQAFEATTAKE